ncbi:hypothetical protein NKH77_22560 [Streptomyces sp. M19]
MSALHHKRACEASAHRRDGRAKGLGMRVARGRIMAAGVALVVVAAGGILLTNAADDDPGPIRVGTTDRVTSLDPAGAYDAGSWALFGNLYQSLLTFRSGAPSRCPTPPAAAASPTTPCCATAVSCARGCASAEAARSPRTM